ncbi:MAG: VCBS domain-containing protein, partial [Luminiphilus sp.]|nr:VCBS domain-containing protein [Luminiphilus sp.]
MGVYGELRVATNNTISYWVTDDAALETALASNASVSETFYYRVANEFGSEDEAQLTITINQANDRPVANPYTITRDYDGNAFTVGTASSDHPLLAGGITDADDNASFVLSGIHEDTSSPIYLSDAASGVALTDFGTVTVNANDELVFTPDAALANLPQGQSLSRSFIYFVSDDGGAYNEGSDGVDRSDKITITINGTADIPVATQDAVAHFYFKNNEDTLPDGSNLASIHGALRPVDDSRFTYAANPSAHGQSNVPDGLLTNLWTVDSGYTVVFDAIVDAEGNERTTPVSRSGDLSQSTSFPSIISYQGSSLFMKASGYQDGNFENDGSLGEGETGIYTFYYRVNVEDNYGNVVSSAIGQLDVTLEGTNDGVVLAQANPANLYDETDSGTGTRITTPVTQSINIYDLVKDADQSDTIRADKITISFNADHTEDDAALVALDGEEFTLLRGETTDDANWDQAAAWGELVNHFSFTFHQDGTIDWVSKRDQFRSADGDFSLYLTDYVENPDASAVSNTTSLHFANFHYTKNEVEFFDDSVAVDSSANGTGSVNGNDILFSSLASFQRSTGSGNVRVAVGETIIGEYITLTMNANGSYSYTVNQEAFDALGDGETALESFTYWGARNPNAGDGIGQATLTFNLTGLADAFVAVNDTARVVAGATISGSSGDLGNQSLVSVYESSGTLISNDINDVGDLTVVGVWLGQEAINATPTTIPSGDNVQVNGTYGVLTIYANGGYDYAANSGVSSEVTEYFTYTVRNGDGEEDTAELAITIVPTADNEFVVEDLSHTMSDIADEAGLTKTVTIANLLTHDASAIRSGNEAGASYAITGYAAGDSGSGFSNVGDTIRGTYGTLTINAAGVPTYVFDRPYLLTEGETGYDVFTFEVTDGRTSATTNTAQLTVQINGRNTTPSWSDDAAIAIAEDTGVTLTKYGDVAAQGNYITRTLNGDGTYDYTYDADAFDALGDGERGYNTALTGGWTNYLEDEFGDVDGYSFGTFDNVTVDRSSYDTTEGWTSWRSGSGQFQDTTIGSGTNQNSILIGSVPFGSNNTNDKITVDNTIQVGQSDDFSVSGVVSDGGNNVNIRGTFEVTVIGVQNTPALTAVNDDVTADEKIYFSFGEYFYSRGSYGPVWGPDAFESVTGDASATEDIFANDTNVPASMDNILRVEVSADGSNWTQVTRNNDNHPSINNNSRIGNSDFYWRKNENSSGGSYVEFAPSGFEALGPEEDPETGEFHYRIVELDGTTTSAIVSTQLTPVDDPPEVHR